MKYITPPSIFGFVMSRLRDMSKIVLMLVFVSVAFLGCGGGGGGGSVGNGAGNGNGNGMMPPAALPVMRTFTNGQTPTAAERTGDARNNVFTITGDITGTDAAMNLILEGPIDGMAGSNSVQLNDGAVVDSIAFSDPPPAGIGGALHLQNIETITIDGGTVNGAIDARAASAGVTFNLNSGMVGSVTGSAQVDSFVIGSGIMVSGTIDGGGGADTLSLAPDFPSASANLFNNYLTLIFSDGDLTLNVADNIEVMIDGLTNGPPRPLSFAPITESAFYTIRNNIIGDARVRTLDSVIDGGGGDNTLVLNGAVVASISFINTAPDAGSGDVRLQNFAVITISGSTVNGAIDASAAPAGVTFNLNSGTVMGNVIGSPQNNDRFVIGGPDITITGRIDGGGGNNDSFHLNTGASVAGIAYSMNAPTGGAVHLQRIPTIEINGGTVNGDLDTSAFTRGLRLQLRNVPGTSVTGSIIGSSEADDFSLEGGTVDGDVNSGAGNDRISLFSAITIRGVLDGGEGESDGLLYRGAPEDPFDPDNPASFVFAMRAGLAEDPDVSDEDGSVRNIEAQLDAPSVGDSLSVRGIERLELSPALNLYGALSDALMQFGQQTAEGFALADLNPQTGRLTQLISKDSPFTKGRIWAHKITHAGNGKGSIGLNLTGLTARAPSDYDYEMSLTQHGFDAPVVSSQWGDFGLRAVSHTMTGTIETNIAEAQVSGYGAGVSLLWRSRELRSLPRHNLSAHITALAGAYEVDAHTSPSNPQAVVNEVSEGSFSAINAVISAGVADKRELANGLVMRTTADVSWQTLSLDDFTETGADGIIINFDKATRFTARIGTGLESEHWFSDIAFVHETSSGGTLSSGLRQDYRQHDGTAIEMKFGGKMADLATGLTIKAFAVWRQSVSGLAGEPSAQFELSYRF